MQLATVIVDNAIVEVSRPQYNIEVALAVLNRVDAGEGSLVHPQNPQTKITWDDDGGVTIQTNTRLTLKNTATGDEATY